MHLYVMQNEHGLLKIGRSVRVEQRRAALEKTEDCRIAIVFVVEDEGLNEEWLHLEMDDHRVIGEWFEGSEEAKAHLLRTLEWTEPVQRPHAFARGEAAEGWLARLEAKRAGRALNRELGRLALDKKQRPLPPESDPGRFMDTHIPPSLSPFRASPLYQAQARQRTP